MRFFAGPGFVTLGMLLLLGQASAQSDSAIAVPAAPAIVAAPPSVQYPSTPDAAPPPGLVETPVPPVNTDTGGSDADAGNSPAAVAPGAPPALAASNVWVPGKTAIIGVLNKVDGSIADVSIPVGGQSSVGDMQVSVLACAVRPPEQVPDAAIFLTTQAADNLSGPPLYRGWIVRSVPGAAVAGNASDTFRVVGCN